MHNLSKVVVTGGAGFIGSHVVAKLLSDGYQVFVIDNLRSGRREYVPLQANFLELDLARADESAVFEVIRDYSPDAVIHLAAIHYIPQCIANPSETFLANVRSTDVLARALRGIHTKKLIAASTADIYPVANRAHVESEAPAPANPYGLSKFLLEEIIAGAARSNPNLSSVALRLFNVYGPGDTNPHVIPRVVELLRSSAPEIRVGATQTTRDFIHIDDVVQAICTTLERDSGPYNVFNVGTGHATPIWQVLRILMQAADDHRQVIEDKNLLRKYDRPFLTSDVTKIRQTLNWRPMIAIEQGLTRLVQQSALMAS